MAGLRRAEVLTVGSVKMAAATRADVFFGGKTAPNCALM
jgi:hypothetical protein